MCIRDRNKSIVFSSQNAADDFKKIYPEHKGRVHILKFASLVPDFDHLDLQELKSKFNIEKKYFIVCNQFWKHKNHKLVLETIKKLSKSRDDFQVVFTGKWDNKSTINYFNGLSDFIRKHKIDGYVKILGFIDRREQLKLLDGSIAVIQPSLFEGWSTVVEDAKAVGKFILVSNIPLHQEQINNNCVFFDPKNAQELAEKMEGTIKASPSKIEANYKENVLKFANDFLEIIQADH